MTRRQQRRKVKKVKKVKKAQSPRHELNLARQVLKRAATQRKLTGGLNENSN